MPKQGFFSFFSMNELMASPRLRPIIERLHPSTVIATVKGVYEDVTREMVSAASERRIPELADLTEKIFARLQDMEKKGNSLLIDASGVLFSSPKLAPALGREVLDEMIWRLDVPPVGFEEESEVPPEDEFIQKVFPDARKVAETFCSLVGAEDAILFHSPETAEFSLFQTFGREGGMVFARRDFYEDSSGRRFTERLPMGVTIHEVGASNRATADDFLPYCGKGTSLIWLASTIHSDLTPTLDDGNLSRLEEGCRAWNIPIVGSFDFAPLFDLSSTILDPLPTVSQLLLKDYHLLLFRTGQLIGGPDCGVLVGTKRFLDKIRKNGFDELFAPHRVDLSGLAKTFDLCRRREQAEMNIPILRTLTTPTANLRNRSERLLPQIQGTSMVESASVEEIETLLYPDARYGRLPSVGVAIRGKGKSPSELASLLADQRPGLKVRIRRNDIVIDLKTVPPRLDSVIVQILENCK